MEQKLLSIGQVARKLHIPVKWLRREVESGSIPSLKIGRRILLNSEAVEQALLKMAAGGAAESGEGGHET